MADETPSAVPAEVVPMAEPAVSSAVSTNSHAASPVAPVTPAMNTVKVRIDAGGREIEVETTDAATSLNALASTALALWTATGEGGPTPEARSLFGLVSSERAAERVPSSSMMYPVEVPH